MANVTAVSQQFKLDSMTALLPAAISTLRAALYLVSGSLSVSKATYGGTVGSVPDTAEVTGTGYTAGGVAVTAANAPVLSGTTACWTPSANIVYPTVTLTTAFDTVLIFDTARANKAIGMWNFGSQTVTAGTLTLTMPTNDAANALLRA